jgi:hypothetical protein
MSTNDWENWAEFDINLLNKGDVVRTLNHACTLAGKDIRDRNKPYDKARKVTLELKFETNEDRAELEVSATVKQTFPAENPHKDSLQIQQSTGRPFHNLMNQQELPVFDPVTGEVSSLIRKENTND